MRARRCHTHSRLACNLLALIYRRVAAGAKGRPSALPIFRSLERVSAGKGWPAAHPLVAKRGRWLRGAGRWALVPFREELPPPCGRSLAKWALLGALIGVISGLGAITFYWMLDPPPTRGAGWLSPSSP